MQTIDKSTLQWRNRGFGMIEILVVLAILGLLIALLVPAWQDYTTRARVAEALVFADAARLPVEEAFGSGAKPPTDLMNATGTPVDGVTALRWVDTDKGKYILVEMELSGLGKRNVFALEHIAANRAWHCRNAGVFGEPNALDDEYLPAECRGKGSQLIAKVASQSGQSSQPNQQSCPPLGLPTHSELVIVKGTPTCAEPCPSGQQRDPKNPVNCVVLAAKPQSQKDCQPHQHFSPEQQRCNDVCNPGWFFDPLTKKCSAKPLASTSASTAPTPASTTHTVSAKPTKDDHPCQQGFVFVPDAGQTSFPMTGKCEKDSKNRDDPYKDTKCRVCSGPIQICERLHHEETCTWPNNICINHLVNADTGARTVDRRCGNRQTAFRKWYLDSSDDDKCTTYNQGFVYTLGFECTYGCTGDGCNSDLNPILNRRDTMYIPPD